MLYSMSQNQPLAMSALGPGSGFTQDGAIQP